MLFHSDSLSYAWTNSSVNKHCLAMAMQKSCLDIKMHVVKILVQKIDSEDSPCFSLKLVKTGARLYSGNVVSFLPKVWLLMLVLRITGTWGRFASTFLLNWHFFSSVILLSLSSLAPNSKYAVRHMVFTGLYSSFCYQNQCSSLKVYTTLWHSNFLLKYAHTFSILSLLSRVFFILFWGFFHRKLRIIRSTY